MAKILSCVEGGMIFTHNKKFFFEMKMRRSHGEKKAGDYIHNILGTNARLTDMQAGIGLAQLKKLNKFILLRNKVAKEYNFLLKKNSKVTLPLVKKNSYNAYFSYPILINNRNKVAKKLKIKYGIDTRIAYKMPIYRQNIYKNKKCPYRKLKCPNAEYVTKKILNLPMFPSLDKNKILYIVKSLNREI